MGHIFTCCNLKKETPKKDYNESYQNFLVSDQEELFVCCYCMTHLKIPIYRIINLYHEKTVFRFCSQRCYHNYIDMTTDIREIE